MTEIDSPPRAHLDHVSHSFPGTGELLHGLDVVLTAGEVVAVVGPSGSGKSTLLHLLAGWREPTSGAVRRTGIRSIAWVFQNPHGSARRTALDHVVLPLLGAGRSRQRAEAEARDHLARVELADVAGRQFRYLSGGESQRLMLARAAAREPDLLLVDEPTAQLDPATAATVSAALAQIAHDGRVVVVATHDPQTRDACTRVVDLAALTRPSAPG